MKILVVDDSKAMRMIVIRTLKKLGLASLEIVEAGSGQEAIGVIKEEQPDIVLCDWNMPEMLGIELLQHIRERGNKVPFGFITSEGSAETKALATEHGAAFVLTKPFTADALESILSPMLA